MILFFKFCVKFNDLTSILKKTIKHKKMFLFCFMKAPLKAHRNHDYDNFSIILRAIFLSINFQGNSPLFYKPYLPGLNYFFNDFSLSNPFVGG